MQQLQESINIYNEVLKIASAQIPGFKAEIQAEPSNNGILLNAFIIHEKSITYIYNKLYIVDPTEPDEAINQIKKAAADLRKQIKALNYFSYLSK